MTGSKIQWVGINTENGSAIDISGSSQHGPNTIPKIVDHAAKRSQQLTKEQQIQLAGELLSTINREMLFVSQEKTEVMRHLYKMIDDPSLFQMDSFNRGIGILATTIGLKSYGILLNKIKNQTSIRDTES